LIQNVLGHGCAVVGDGNLRLPALLLNADGDAVSFGVDCVVNEIGYCFVIAVA
jgi:hypothetical protein